MEDAAAAFSRFESPAGSSALQQAKSLKSLAPRAGASMPRTFSPHPRRAELSQGLQAMAALPTCLAKRRFGALKGQEMGKSISRAVAFLAVAATAGPALAAQDADEAALLQNFDKVDVWHFPVDTTVRYNNQDAIVTRELVFQPEPPKGELCHVRFDLVKGEGDYGYGFKPGTKPQDGKAVWGTNVLKRGDILNQWYSALKLNVVYFFVEGPKSSAAKEVCAQRQSAPTAEAGNAYKGPWSDLVTKTKAIHGWPARN